MLGEFSNKKDDVINDYEHNTIGVFNQNDAMINDHEYDIVGEFWKKMITWLNDYEYEGCHNTKHNWKNQFMDGGKLLGQKW